MARVRTEQDPRTGHWRIRLVWQGQDVRRVVANKQVASIVAGRLTEKLIEGTFRLADLDLATNPPGSDSRIETFEDLATKFLDGCTTICTATKTQYEQVLKTWRCSFGEKWDGEAFVGTSWYLERVTAAEVERIYNRAIRESRNGSTCHANRMLTVLRAAFRKGVAWGAIEKDPTAGIRKQTEPKRGRYLTVEEHERLKAGAVKKGTPWLLPILECAYHTGGRLGDILGDQYGKEPLRWESVDLDAERPFLVFTKTKEKKDRRVPVNTKLLSVLLPLREARVGSLAKRAKATGPVFLDDDGRAVRASRISRALTAAAREAEIGGQIRTHDFRHTFLTNLANSGRGTLEQRMMVAGHRTYQTHLRYLHPDETGIEELVEFTAELQRAKTTGTSKATKARARSRKGTALIPVATATAHAAGV